jgi:hypothetical protein
MCAVLLTVRTFAGVCRSQGPDLGQVRRDIDLNAYSEHEGVLAYEYARRILDEPIPHDLAVRQWQEMGPTLRATWIRLALKEGLNPPGQAR